MAQNGRPGAYWYRMPDGSDFKDLKEAVKNIQSFRTLDHEFLSRVIHKLSVYHQMFPRESGHSVAKACWDKIEKNWFKAVLPQVDQLSFKSVVSIMRATWELKAEMPDDFSAGLVRASKAWISQFNPAHLSNYLQVVVERNMELSPDLGDALVQVANRKITSFEPRHLSCVSHYFAELGIRPSDADFESYCHQAEELLPKFTPQNHVSFLWGLAVAGFAPSRQFQNAFYKSVKKNLMRSDDAGAFESKHCANLLWTTAVLSVIGRVSHEGRQVVPMLYDRMNVSRLASHVSHAVNHASRCLAPEQVGRFNLCQGGAAGSSMERTFIKKVVDAGFVIDHKRHYIEGLETFVDMPLKFGHKCALVELDGPYHYADRMAVKPCLLNGSTRLMTKLIRDVRPEQALVRMPYWIVQSMEDVEIKPMISRIAALEPAAYQLSQKFDATWGKILSFDKIPEGVPYHEGRGCVRPGSLEGAQHPKDHTL